MPPGASEEVRDSGAAPVDVSIVTVTYNNVEDIDGFLDSIAKQGASINLEVIAVDNGSTDGTIELLRARRGVRLFVNRENAGYPLAMNRGIAAARGRYLILCNPDLVFRAGSITALRHQLDARPELGGVGPVIETPGEPPGVYPVLTTDPGVWYGWNFFSGSMMKCAPGRGVNQNQDPTGAPGRELPWLHGCCAMYRRSALADVSGGFDERFFLYFEDCDLGRSLRDWGWRLAVAADARVLHLEERSARAAKVATRVYFMESWHLYQRKHAGWVARTAGYLVVLAALTLQSAVQGAKAALARAHTLPVALAYLRTHLSAPLRNLEDERERAVGAIRAAWERETAEELGVGRVSAPLAAAATQTDSLVR